MLSSSSSNKYMLTLQQKITRKDLLKNISRMILNSNSNIHEQILIGETVVKKKSINVCVDQCKDRKQDLHQKYYISKFTNDDAENMKSMIYHQKQHQEELQAKAKEHQQKIREFHMQEIQALEAYKLQQHQNRKKQIMEGIEQIRKRRSQRIALKDLQNQKINELKKKKTLFEKMQDKRRKQQSLQNLQKYDKMKRLKQTRQVSFDDIKRHATKYNETMTKMRESRINSSRINNPNAKKFYESTFRSRVIEEDITAKSRIFQKNDMARQFAQKRADFAQIVRENYKPQHFRSGDLNQIPEEPVHRSMSHKQLNAKGVQYLRQANQNANKKKKPQLKSEFARSQHNYFKYKNYLTEMRTRRSQQLLRYKIPDQKQKDNNRRIKVGKQIQKIMKKQEINNAQKFQEAKLVIKRMQYLDYEKKNPFKLIDSINAKIEVLKRMEG